ncbi:MAG: type II toxin-antitoxin system Phd/YefM family antitoxin [Bradymonadales bacterium]|nr:type II toxin-antitoxin system Phd/YefM family antitoxin [Bradymonadales bacterium]
MSQNKISTTELKAQAARVVERVARQRTPVLITRHGRPLARLVPVEQEVESLFGFASGCVTVHGDLLEPIDVEWEAAK